MSVLLLIMCWAPHKFHASLTQMEHNAQSQSVEVVLRLFADDLENTLSKRSDSRVVLDKNSQEVERLVFAYVAEQFRPRNAQGNPIGLKWVGLEVDVQTAWVYVEFEAADLVGISLENKIFFELFDDQVNTVNVTQGKQRATLIFKSGDKAQFIKW